MYEDDVGYARKTIVVSMVERVLVFRGALWFISHNRGNFNFYLADAKRVNSLLESIPGIVALNQVHSETTRIGPSLVEVSTDVWIEFGFFRDEKAQCIDSFQVRPDWIRRMEPVLKKALAFMDEKGSAHADFAPEQSMENEEATKAIDAWLRRRKAG